MRASPRSSVDLRMTRAVMLVLAGCQRSPEAHASDSVVTTATSAAALATATAMPEGPTVAPEPSATAVPNVAVRAEPNAVELCALHKESVKVDLTRVKGTKTAEYQPMVRERAAWDPQRERVVCTIIRATEETTIEVTRVPTCCPKPGPPSPCPPAYKEKAPGTRVVIEQVELHPDGKVAASHLAALGFEKNPPGRHTCGRQPEGLVLSAPSTAASSVGAELACMAELEAASVPAFQRLARELDAHGAPPRLVGRANDAARDEVYHARAMKRLAREYGATVGSPHHGALGVRELLPIAIENVVEGCVREAYGALVATFQGERAATALRRTFRHIAKDERAHATLAEDVNQWLVERLDDEGRAQVERARAAAEADLRTSLETAVGCDELGLPDRHLALALFEAYFEEA